MGHGSWGCRVVCAERAHMVLDRLPGIIDGNSILKDLDTLPWCTVNSRYCVLFLLLLVLILLPLWLPASNSGSKFPPVPTVGIE